MKALNCLRFAASALLALLTPGCLIVECAPSHSFWPKPIAANDLRQFEGSYRNHSFETIRETDEERTPQLFDFLTGEVRPHDDRGVRVELHFAPDESSLHVRLFDQQGREIDSATLQRGTAFALSNGVMELYGPFSGWQNDSGNFGPNAQYQRDTLNLASVGGLLGHERQNEMGLLFDVIPVASTRGTSMFWPKL